eukprot:TRINITY_DN2112_c0_g1_i1.p1 TRINITY_DN2112_c0_g1~~TRINITY_DN2112_c0_g1_i1.p1  ORF type:complete len:126 (-),score=11.75 TRINITY_DN2112_c0_g1_i1:54-383(-)
MLSHSDRQSLETIEEHLTRMIEYVNVEESEFTSSTVTQDAVGYNICIIGDTIKEVTYIQQKNLTHVKWWLRFRQVIAHKYGVVDWVLVYTECKSRAPQLLEAVETLLAS